VAAISRLETSLAAREAEVKVLEEKVNQLRREMLLREDNYNKHFRNGGAGEKVLGVDAAMGSHAGVMDWMLGSSNSSKRRSSVGGGSPASTSFKNRG
jgi:hypothetical protein